ELGGPLFEDGPKPSRFLHGPGVNAFEVPPVDGDNVKVLQGEADQDQDAQNQKADLERFLDCETDGDPQEGAQGQLSAQDGPVDLVRQRRSPPGACPWDRRKMPALGAPAAFGGGGGIRTLGRGLKPPQRFSKPLS